MAKSITYSTESNLFAYVVRHFQERNRFPNDNVVIKSCVIDAGGVVINYTTTNSRGDVAHRIVAMDHEGLPRGDLIVG